MPEHRAPPQLPWEGERGTAGPPGAPSDATRLISSIDGKRGGGERRKGEGRHEPFPRDAAESPHAHVQAGVRGQRPPRGARPCLNTGPPHAAPNETGSGLGPARREASPTRPRSAWGIGSGSRVQVRMRCETRTRRRRHEPPTSSGSRLPTSLASAGTSPGTPPALLPPSAGTPARALAHSLSPSSRKENRKKKKKKEEGARSLSLACIRYAPAAR